MLGELENSLWFISLRKQIFDSDRHWPYSMKADKNEGLCWVTSFLRNGYIVYRVAIISLTQTQILKTTKFLTSYLLYNHDEVNKFNGEV